MRLRPELCGECGGCVAVCAFEALELNSQGLRIKKELCILCNDCVIFCPSGALEMADER
ncbi:MAG: 4Fe-4S dicluster domain-containing protein [candidate division Zixibacteria bacterium]|nr:4Fe-4S dicluster domain-containing protein [candidate division Zixibacteria bacterium]